MTARPGLFVRNKPEVDTDTTASSEESHIKSSWTLLHPTEINQNVKCNKLLLLAECIMQYGYQPPVARSSTSW